MTVRVDLAKLYALADKLEGLEKDIYSLSNTATSASDSVLSRTNRRGYAPLISACTKAVNSTKQAKDLTSKLCGNLALQAGILRNAAYSYKVNDKIDRVN